AVLVSSCILDGGQWGDFTSNLYCELSIELNGLGESETFVRAPVGLCGTLFESVCDNTYQYVATEGRIPLQQPVKSFLSQHGVSPQPYPGCLPHTTGEYAPIFSSAMNSDCSYAP